MNSSPKELKRNEKHKLKMNKFGNLSELMMQKVRGKAKKRGEVIALKKESISRKQEQSFSLMKSMEGVRIEELLRESQLKRESHGRKEKSRISVLRDSNYSMKPSFQKQEIDLENVMNSSVFLRKENSLKNSEFQGTPSKSNSKIYQPYSRSPDRVFAKKKKRLLNSDSKGSFHHKNLKANGQSRQGGSYQNKKNTKRKNVFDTQNDVDLYNGVKRTKSPESVSVLDAMNIYGKVFYTMNNVKSSKATRQNSIKTGSGSGSRESKASKFTGGSNPKNSKLKKQSLGKRFTQESKSRVTRMKSHKSPKREEIRYHKHKPKSRSNEPKKHRKAEKKIKKKGLIKFKGSHSRSMSSPSDVSQNRSKSLNKTNSELKKSGSFIEADQHIGKVKSGYKFQKLLGEGAYAKVYEALHMFTKTPVAIKSK